MRSTVPQPGGTVPLTWARANLGPLVRWTHTTGERTTITDRHGATAVLISTQEHSALQAPRPRRTPQIRGRRDALPCEARTAAHDRAPLAPEGPPRNRTPDDEGTAAAPREPAPRSDAAHDAGRGCGLEPEN